MGGGGVEKNDPPTPRGLQTSPASLWALPVTDIKIH